MAIFSEEITAIGSYEFDLTETDQVTDYTYTQHVVLNITGCFNVPDEDRQSEASLNYTIGQAAPLEYTVKSMYPTCNYSHFEVESPSNNELLTFMSVDDSKQAQITVKVHIDSKPSTKLGHDLAGIYNFVIKETDERTGFSSVLNVELVVNRPVNIHEHEGGERKPLIAKIYDFTPEGNLTITFNKPIILPKIFVHNITDSSSESETRELKDKQTFQYLQIDEVLKIQVEPSFYEDDSVEV